MMVLHTAAKERHAIAECFAGMTGAMSHPELYLVVGPGCIDQEEYGTGFYKLMQDDYHGKGKFLSKWLAYKYYRNLWKEMKAAGINRLFLFSESEWSYLTMYLALPLRKLQLYLFVHDPKEHSGEEWIVRMMHRVTMWCVGRRAQKIFVSYQDGIQQLTDKNPILKGRKILAVPLPGMRSMEFPDIRELAGAFDADHPYDLIFYGRLEAYKGLDVLVEALQLLAARDSHPKLLIVGGKGQLAGKIKEITASLQHVTHVNRYVTNRELAEYIAASKVVVLPYRDATGTQTVQIANYYKRPVIANRTGAFPEYVTHGENGLLLDTLSATALARAIETLLTDAAMAQQMRMPLEIVYNARFNVSDFAGKLQVEMEKS